ncbi:MAG: ATP-binding protein [Thermoguttaceae bacterium]|jgi:nitrogen fixation/metabolism regulation signal transduction histidine kinase
MNDRIPLSRQRKTYFAPANRDSSHEFRRKVAAVEENPLLREVLNAMPGMVLVLNANRQIVSANQAVLGILDCAIEDVLEKRPGEALGCIRAKDAPDGCGTNQHCVTCGAVNAILESQNLNAQVVRECRIRVAGASGDGHLDLKVTATPITLEGEQFVVAAIEDISHAKRLDVLQRVFFHDVLNTAFCISAYTNSLTKDQKSVEDAGKLLKFLSDELIEEINAQRDLLAAESGDLKLFLEPVATARLLEELRLKYLKNPEADGRKVELCSVWDGTIQTDRRLLRRVLSNMLKNGLEATAPGQTVTLNCSEHGQLAAFTVHNREVMPHNVQLQIFQRSFSTKAQTGRGIGTYSIKLLGEQYLGGKVEFTSREPDGTAFVLTLPKMRDEG